MMIDKKSSSPLQLSGRPAVSIVPPVSPRFKASFDFHRAFNGFRGLPQLPDVHQGMLAIALVLSATDRRRQVDDASLPGFYL